MNLRVTKRWNWSGGHSRVDTPVPIPNTEVKHPHADGTTVSRGRVGSRRIFLFFLTDACYPCRMSAIRFIVYKGLQNLLLIHPVYTLLFQSSGLSLEQVSLLLAIWSVPVVLLEIPADFCPNDGVE